MNTTAFKTAYPNKIPLLVTSALLLCTGCLSSNSNPPPIAEEVGITEELSVPAETVITLKDDTYNLTFTYPAAWGTWKEPNTLTLESVEEVTEKTFSELEKSDAENIHFVFRRYNSSEYRFEEVCDTERSIDLCDVTKLEDITEQKQQFNKTATVLVAGLPATIITRYDAPSGFIMREVTFYTPTHRVQIYGSYSVLEFLVSQQLTTESDLLTTAKRVFGDNLQNMTEELQKHTSYAEPKLAVEFFSDMVTFVDSIEIIAPAMETYSNTRYNYLIQYPSNWFAYTNDSENDFTERGQNPTSLVGGDTVFSN